MTPKQQVLQTLSRLPDDVSSPRIKEEFEILSALNEAEEDLEKKIHTHEESKGCWSHGLQINLNDLNLLNLHPHKSI